MPRLHDWLHLICTVIDEIKRQLSCLTIGQLIQYTWRSLPLYIYYNFLWKARLARLLSIVSFKLFADSNLRQIGSFQIPPTDRKFSPWKEGGGESSKECLGCPERGGVLVIPSVGGRYEIFSGTTHWMESENHGSLHTGTNWQKSESSVKLIILYTRWNCHFCLCTAENHCYTLNLLCLRLVVES